MTTSLSIRRPKRWDVPFSREFGSYPELVEIEVDRLLSIPPFRDLDASNFSKSLPLRDILKNDARIIKLDDGDIIVHKGDWGNSAFFILQGVVRAEVESRESTSDRTKIGGNEKKWKGPFQTIARLWKNQHKENDSRSTTEPQRIFLQDVSVVLDEHRSARIDGGQWFGEVAALSRTPRIATVTADGPVELLEIRWQGLRDIMRRDRQECLKHHIENIFRERALEAFLRNEPLFRHLDNDQMDQLVSQVEFQTYGTYDSPAPFKNLATSGANNRFNQEPIVVEEGDYPNGLILIRSGVARLCKRHHHDQQTVGYLTAGQSFGYQEIAEGWNSDKAVPLRHSLRAIGYLNVIVVPTVLVEQFLLKPTATPTKSSPASSPTPIQSTSSQQPQPSIDSHLLNFLVDQRQVQGSATMVIDLNRCTRCDDCVRACASTHDNTPRFIREGSIHGQYMFANACMHCTDPVCLIECPTGAIHRDQQSGVILINEQTCIGCTSCANNCPFDAIQMVELRDNDGRLFVDELTSQPLMQATKCDLCIDQSGGPACQSACPHDALFRIDLQKPELLEETFMS